MGQGQRLPCDPAHGLIDPGQGKRLVQDNGRSGIATYEARREVHATSDVSLGTITRVASESFAASPPQRLCGHAGGMLSRVKQRGMVRVRLGIIAGLCMLCAKARKARTPASHHAPVCTPVEGSK